MGENSFDTGGAMKLVLRFGWVAVLLFACVCQAETQWCKVTGRAAEDTLVYPPIARAARVSGVIVGRLTYLPPGQVTGFDWVSGQPLLQSAVEGQVSNWKLTTNTRGDAPCVTLLVVKFNLGDLPNLPSGPTSPTILRFDLSAEPFRQEFVIYDPAPKATRWQRLRSLFRRRHPVE